MDSAEIRFIPKTFIKKRGGEVFRKIRPSPILWEPFKDSVPPSTAGANSETSSQHGNDIHRVLWDRHHLCRLFQRLLSFPTLFEEPLVPTLLQSSSHMCKHRGVFIAPLPISQSVHSAVAYREKQHSNCKISLRHWLQITNLFIPPSRIHIQTRLFYRIRIRTKVFRSGSAPDVDL